jgi:hypothetical protein
MERAFDDNFASRSPPDRTLLNHALPASKRDFRLASRVRSRDVANRVAERSDHVWNFS